MPAVLLTFTPAAKLYSNRYGNVPAAERIGPVSQAQPRGRGCSKKTRSTSRHARKFSPVLIFIDSTALPEHLSDRRSDGRTVSPNAPSMSFHKTLPQSDARPSRPRAEPHDDKRPRHTPPGTPGSVSSRQQPPWLRGSARPERQHGRTSRSASLQPTGRTPVRR